MLMLVIKLIKNRCTNKVCERCPIIPANSVFIWENLVKICEAGYYKMNRNTGKAK